MLAAILIRQDYMQKESADDKHYPLSSGNRSEDQWIKGLPLGVVLRQHSPQHYPRHSPQDYPSESVEKRTSSDEMLNGRFF